MKAFLKKNFKPLFYIALGLGGLLSLGLYFLIFTTSGLQFAIDKTNSLLSDFVKIEAHIEDGSLWQGFSTSGRLSICIPDIITVSADNFAIDYDLFLLAKERRLNVEKISADYLQVNLHLKDSNNSDENTEPASSSQDEIFKLHFPVAIDVNSLDLKNFSYMSDVVDVVIDKADLHLQAHDSFAAIVKGEVNKVIVYLNPDSEADGSRIKDDSESDNEALVALEEIELKTPQEMAKAQYIDPDKFAVVNLPLEVSVDSLHINSGRYYMTAFDTGLISDLNLKAHWLDTKLEVENLSARHSLGELSVTGTMDFYDWYYMDFNLSGKGAQNEATLHNYAGALYGLEGKAKVLGDISKLRVDALITSPEAVKASGFIRPLDGTLPLALDLNVQKMTYPFVRLKNEEPAKAAAENKELQKQDKNDDEAQTLVSPIEAYRQDPALSISNLKFAVSGELFKTLTLDLKANLNGMGMQDLKLDLKSDANLTQALVHNLNINGKYQKSPVDFSYKGNLEYLNSYTVAGKLKLDAADAKGIHQELKGKLSLESDLLFTYQNPEEILFNIENLKSDFHLNGNPSKLYAENLNGDLQQGFDIGLLKFEQARNHLKLRGSLSEESDFNGSFALNSLKDIVPSLDGAVSGRLKIEGNYMMPEATIIANSKRLKYDNVAIRNFIVNAMLKPQNEEFSFTLLSDTLRLGKGGPLYRQCSFDLSGTLSSHRLSFACGGAYRSFAGAFGSYDKEKGIYSGNISDLVIESTLTEPITLRAPVNFSYNLQKATGNVDAVEITDTKTDIKIAKTVITPNLIKTNLVVDGFDLNYFNVISPRDYNLSGRINAEAFLEIVSGKFEVKSSITSSSGRIDIPNYHIAYDSFGIDLLFNQSKAAVKVKGSLSHNDGDLDIDIGIRDPLSRKELFGKVNLADLNLDLFAAAGGVFNQLQGKANIQGSLGGSLSKPLFFGDIRLAGAAEPHFNIGTINDFDMHVHANGDHGSLLGLIKINDGNLNLTGNLNWADGANGQLEVRATSLPLFLLGYGEAYIDIDTQAILSDALYVRGHINIPKARINVSSLDSQAQNPSKDEVYIEHGGADALIAEHRQRQSPIDMDINLNINMGNDVMLDAMGLKSHIIGSLVLKKDRHDKEIEAEGTISLDNAKAEIYGHRFIVNYADTIFKGKIDNPQLRAEVIADPFGIEDDVVAGVHVTGNASDPVIELFSKPAMSQNEILSYLLYGHGLEKNTDDSSGQNSQFLMTLGLGTTTGLINSLAGALGMQGVQFASSGSGDETTVGVQTYITKNIRLSYGYGVFTSLSEFRIRYELMRKLYAEFISSIDQSVDLIYSFEFD